MEEYKNENLLLDPVELMPWLDGMLMYQQCYNRYWKQFYTLSDLENELHRPHINTVCRKELTNLKQIAPTIGYREVHARRNDMTDLGEKYGRWTFQENLKNKDNLH